MSEPKLKLCPFCGASEPHLKVGSSGETDNYFEVVVCNSCGIMGPVSYDNEPGGGINLWNNRPAADAEIARLKERIAELEKGAHFCSLLYSPWRDSVRECLVDFFGRWGAVEITPVRIKRETSLPDVWGVLVPGRNDKTTAHTFPTKEEAEAFCQKMRAEKGEGE